MTEDKLALNKLRNTPGSRRDGNRVGRGISAGQGKTCGRGHKGQNSRSGGGVRLGFEGGQLPLQKRVPTFGFTSRIARQTAEVRLSELKKVEGDNVSLQTLQLAGIISRAKKRARIIASGEIDRAFTVSDVHVTKTARVAIEAAGGSIVE